MKFSIGYQQQKREEIIRVVIAHPREISEVYFAFGTFPNGRGNAERGEQDFIKKQQQISDLKKLASYGISINFLLNGNCYGKYALARSFFNDIGDLIEYFCSEFGLASVTTTSPIIAKFVKDNFREVHTRASVNMEIGSIAGMRYLQDIFDGFYMKRENNRDLPLIRRLKAWCDSEGKQLYALFNSGCLNGCSAHVFHDNLVAHEREIAEMDNAYVFRGICSDFVQKEENRISLVRDTNFIRPEDVPLYEGLFASAKLATRINRAPARVIEAYLQGKYVGNILDLLEPDHAGAVYPWILENSKFPQDFAERVATCNKNCADCGYCEEVYRCAAVKLEV